MNKMNILSSITCAILVIALSATVGCTLKGENNMATITTLNNSDAMSVSRASINTNFSNVNSELIADTTAIGTLASLTTTNKTDLVSAVNEVNATKVTSIYGELWSTVETVGTLNLSSDLNYSYFTSNLGLKIGSGITYDTSALKIGTTGKYLITFTCTIGSDTDMTSVQLQLLKNGTALVNGKISEFFTTGTEYRSVSSCCIEDLTANDLIKIGFRRDAPVTFNLVVWNYHLTITKV